MSLRISAADAWHVEGRRHSNIVIHQSGLASGHGATLEIDWKRLLWPLRDGGESASQPYRHIGREWCECEFGSTDTVEEPASFRGKRGKANLFMIQ